MGYVIVVGLWCRVLLELSAFEILRRCGLGFSKVSKVVGAFCCLQLRESQLFHRYVIVRTLGSLALVRAIIVVVSGGKRTRSRTWIVMSLCSACCSPELFPL